MGRTTRTVAARVGPAGRRPAPARRRSVPGSRSRRPRCLAPARRRTPAGARTTSWWPWPPPRATVVAAWLVVGAIAAAAALRAGPAAGPPLVPALVHRGTAVVLGVTLAAGAPAASPAAGSIDPGWRPTTPPPPAAPATAAAPVRTDPVLPTGPAEQAPDPGWRPASAPAPVPARTVAEPIDPVLLTGARQPPDERVLVTVRRGDTLWDLAARAARTHGVRRGDRRASGPAGTPPTATSWARTPTCSCRGSSWSRRRPWLGRTGDPPITGTGRSSEPSTGASD